MTFIPSKFKAKPLPDPVGIGETGTDKARVESA